MAYGCMFESSNFVIVVRVGARVSEQASGSIFNRILQLKPYMKRKKLISEFGVQDLS